MSTGREEQEAAKKKKSLTQATLAFGSLQLAHGQLTVLSAPANQEVVAAAAAAATEAAQAVVEASLPGGCRVVAIFCMQLLVFGDHDRIEHVGPLVGHGYWA